MAACCQRRAVDFLFDVPTFFFVTAFFLDDVDFLALAFAFDALDERALAFDLLLLRDARADDFPCRLRAERERAACSRVVRQRMRLPRRR